eukprot:COSAG01_NODE_6244_length_3770_cov_36.061530_6_plen_99_part_00
MCCGRRVIPAPSLRYGGGDGDDAVGGTTVQLVIESPWSQFTCECRRFGHPPRRNDQPFWTQDAVAGTTVQPSHGAWELRPHSRLHTPATLFRWVKVQF